LSDGRRLKPGGSAKSPIEIIRGLCHSDLRVRSRYLTLSPRNIGPKLL
jgi:hypothetical protein